MSFSSTEVCKLAGCTYRQLDYWVAKEWIVPVVDSNGSGTQREFDQATIDIIKMTIQLVDAGLLAQVALRAATIVVETGQPTVSANRLITVWAPRASR